MSDSGTRFEWQTDLAEPELEAVPDPLATGDVVTLFDHNNERAWIHFEAPAGSFGGTIR